MYLLGALNGLAEGLGFRSFKTYGLLLIRNELSIGVELEIDSKKSSVNILWVSSDVDRLERVYSCIIEIEHYVYTTHG